MENGGGGGGGGERKRRNRGGRNRNRSKKHEGGQPQDQQQQQQGGPATTTIRRPQRGPGGGIGSNHALPRNNNTKFSNRTTSTTLAHMTSTRFADLPINESVKRAIAEVMQYETCTEVQAQALPACLGEQDCMVKAKTGTGKTIAFLVPAIEKVLHNPPPRGQVPIVIMSPTRELAQQIGQEAEALLTFLDWKVMTVYGGTNVRADVSNLKRRAPDVLVATPGRLNDLFQNGGLNQMVKQVGGSERKLGERKRTRAYARSRTHAHTPKHPRSAILTLPSLSFPSLPSLSFFLFFLFLAFARTDPRDNI